jgi:hypothetical protein
MSRNVKLTSARNTIQRGYPIGVNFSQIVPEQKKKREEASSFW